MDITQDDFYFFYIILKNTVIEYLFLFFLKDLWNLTSKLNEM